mmetsp:Transcript_9455/g.31337  ORF Transcript_9455/g.31337 Transcript_9455/m.31337 type:complete len:233 (+) Transcript_9455:442-1140(+)
MHPRQRDGAAGGGRRGVGGCLRGSRQHKGQRRSHGVLGGRGCETAGGRADGGGAGDKRGEGADGGGGGRISDRGPGYGHGRASEGDRRADRDEHRMGSSFSGPWHSHDRAHKGGKRADRGAHRMGGSGSPASCRNAKGVCRRTHRSLQRGAQRTADRGPQRCPRPPSRRTAEEHGIAPPHPRKGRQRGGRAAKAIKGCVARQVGRRVHGSQPDRRRSGEHRRRAAGPHLRAD